MAKIRIFIVCCLSTTLYAVAQQQNATTLAHDQKPAASNQAVTYTVPSFWPDSWRSGISQLVSVGGVLFSGLLIFAALTWLFGLSGLSRLRVCNLFGNCEKSAVNYSNGGNLDPAAQSNSFNDASQYYNYPTGYIQKRSINLLAPMLQKLAATFEDMEKTLDTKKQ